MLTGKTAIVTGAAGGIGLATVKLFCRQHATVYAFVRKAHDDFQSEVEKMRADGAQIFVICCDLQSDESISAALKELTAKTKQIDILVNNAGAVADSTSFQMTAASKIRQIFDVNFFGQTALTQYVSRLMARKKQGSIVNVTSVAAIDGTPGQYEYVCSKAAMIGATRELAIELGKSNIRVNAIAPGITETKMATNISEDLHKETLQHSVMKRMALPEEIANAVLFLASDMSSYVTGQILRVDGGIF